MPGEVSLGRGLIDRIGLDQARISQTSPAGAIDRRVRVDNHGEAIAILQQTILDPTHGILRTLDQIEAVGHRVVHGGEQYSESVIIDGAVIAAIRAAAKLAPLHNPANLMGIEQAMRSFPSTVQVAVFDTAFHQTLAPAAFLYALPRSLYERFGIRRYGFHGTSHRYVAEVGAAFAKRSPENTNVISCHLGNGASITSIAAGKSVDTSMGFTPLEGLVMGTRSGDIDPSIIFFLIERGFNPEDINQMLNKQSGLLGLSGVSNDLRDIERAAEAGDTRAIEALDVYAYRVRKYIGAYAANLVRVDLVIFTGGIGQFGVKMRERICHRLENLGIHMDYQKNQNNGPNLGVISTEYSPVTILVVPTNEELQIAKDTYHLMVKPRT